VDERSLDALRPTISTIYIMYTALLILQAKGLPGVLPGRATTMLRSPSGTQFPLVPAFELRAARAKLALVGVGRDLAAVRRTTWACAATGKP
jgi:hypothetical protein